MSTSPRRSNCLAFLLYLWFPLPGVADSLIGAPFANLINPSITFCTKIITFSRLFSALRKASVEIKVYKTSPERQDFAQPDSPRCFNDYEKKY